MDETKAKQLIDKWLWDDLKSEEWIKQSFLKKHYSPEDLDKLIRICTDELSQHEREVEEAHERYEAHQENQKEMEKRRQQKQLRDELRKETLMLHKIEFRLPKKLRDRAMAEVGRSYISGLLRSLLIQHLDKKEKERDKQR